MKRCLKTRILPFVCLVVLFITSLVVPIGAENVSSGIVSAAVPAPSVPSYLSPVDWTDYSGSNLLPYPYSYLGPTNVSYTNAGVTYTLRDYGIVITSGGLTSSFSFMYLTRDLVLVPGVYTLSSGGPVVIKAWCKDRSSNTEFALPDGTFEVPVGSNWEIDIYLVVDGSSSINATVYPMLNKGVTAYPYQPYLPYWIQEAYGSGYTSGWNSAYDRGYYQGKDDAYSFLDGVSASVLTRCTYIAFVYRSDPVTGESYGTRLGEFTPNLSSNGVFFKSLWAKVNDLVTSEGDPDWNYVDRVGILMNWTESGSFNYDQFPIFVGGNSLLDSAELLTLDGKRYTLSGDSSDVSSWRLSLPQGTVGPVMVQSIGFYVGRPYDLLNEIYLASDSSFYSQGYDAGYASGYITGVNLNYDSVRQEFYNQGYNSGYSVGKVDGINISQNGSFSSLMAAVVDAPVKAITGLLDFEILGQNMLSFMGSLLSLSLILIFVKKVVL